MAWKDNLFFVCCGMLLTGIVGCGQGKTQIITQDPHCAPHQLKPVAGSRGSAQVFLPDPIGASKNASLLPNCSSTQLDNYRTSVTLSRLGGDGVLRGSHVQVLNGLNCNDGFGAYDLDQVFSYSHSDFRFQEAMAYYFGDIYQESIVKSGYLKSSQPVIVVAHCMLDDNAFFARGYGPDGNLINEVCLGDSVKTPGAYYADDGTVIIHELQHANTQDNYSTIQSLSQFGYDEAGALNEALSDFMGVLFTNQMVPLELSLDPRIFSRWALGRFDPKVSHLRGANQCPAYDSRYPNCDNFPSFGTPSAQDPQVKISYVYPDGVGWPFSDQSGGASSVYKTFTEYTSQEEIHNAGIVMLGALWDVYTALKNNHREWSGNDANHFMTQLALESIRGLPAANSVTNHSPVNFIGYASNLEANVELIPGSHSGDKEVVGQVLKNRGLYQMPLLQDGWMEVGSGSNFRMPSSVSSGVYIEDHLEILKKWLNQVGRDHSADLIKPQFSVENGLLDPGEVAAIWFDIENRDLQSAGGVLVTVTSRDSDVMIIDGPPNRGYLTLSGENQTQVMYGKINGTSIVSLMNDDLSTEKIPLGNSYFKTNPFFNRTWRTSVWVKVNPNAHHGKHVSFEVRAAPSNGVVETLDFHTVIH